ncbi:hypothetical protein NLM33_37680 [Bradyrhizobium sp. CCGUVB1N3]|uniref:hypothetical protein n=1 Tax=Bradyrhizobium sp. CCGUVB1N3 TaxID=2949629 RepID=UPI0020B1E56E|nr:hypothetical protein [Bradyrhizobium sp. CCGUVB1N3]MCP3475970.1 hypothetical protein [Bradyrhizobium sp. CCGUVB1N3]
MRNLGIYDKELAIIGPRPAMQDAMPSARRHLTDIFVGSVQKPVASRIKCGVEVGAGGDAG